ncbi:amidohydrolase family protein [Lacisediminihabitans profunda]|uniref:amidohydrolase family protein n=1 Tax=Lacisediminihabitans profunda TaxID=2594790 RepID=UPI00164FF448|nr:amidohydrolase family protein [Lacisediminihabitans profunda]
MNADAPTASDPIRVDEVWLGGWRGPSLLRVRDGALEYLSPAGSAHHAGPRLAGTILPGFVDSHVHLGLVDASGLVAGGISRVVDLGWDPAVASGWAGSTGPDAVDVEFAGAFLTARGGYPGDRSWAPPEAVRELSTGAEASAAVAEMVGFGASVIKIALNSEAGPVWSDALLEDVVAAAHAADLPVVAHAEGPGQAMRAVAAGVETLAHTPWTERLTDDEVAASAARCAWTSTLDIHGWGDRGRAYDTAIDNLGRFAALGGRVLYGTDLGNGPLPVGLNARELAALGEAGLSTGDLVRALIRSSGSFGARFTWIPGEVAPGREGASWLSTASVVSLVTMEEIYS